MFADSPLFSIVRASFTLESPLGYSLYDALGSERRASEHLSLYEVLLKYLGCCAGEQIFLAAVAVV